MGSRYVVNFCRLRKGSRQSVWELGYSITQCLLLTKAMQLQMCYNAQNKSVAHCQENGEGKASDLYILSSHNRVHMENFDYDLL